MTPMKVDLLVIGGGPTGLTVAAEVAASGASVLLVEKRGAEPVTRAGTLLPRPLELFDARGIADRFIRKAAEVAPFPFVPAHVYGGIRPIDWAPLESRYGFTMSIPQNYVEQLLRTWAVDSGADVRLKHTLLDLAQDGEYVHARVEAPQGTTEVTARYAVAADGGRSTSRRLLGIPSQGHGPTFTGMIADLGVIRGVPAGRRGAANELGWMSAFPIGEGATRLVIIHRDRMATPQEEPVTLEELQSCVHDIMGDEVSIDDLRWSSRYSDTLRLADQFRSDRVFLVGESARIHYPASGIGMNFCIQDAFNIGWKLAAVLTGLAGDDLLNTYSDERRPVAEDLLASVETQVALQFNFTREGMALKKHFAENVVPIYEMNRRLCLELCGIARAYPSAGPAAHALTGRPVPDVDLIMTDGHSSRVHELLHDGNFLLLNLSGLDGYESIQSMKLPLRVVSAYGLRLPEAMRGVKALLVRPDTYVAWTETAEPQPDRALRELNRWIHVPPTPATSRV